MYEMKRANQLGVIGRSLSHAIVVHEWHFSSNNKISRFREAQPMKTGRISLF